MNQKQPKPSDIDTLITQKRKELTDLSSGKPVTNEYGERVPLKERDAKKKQLIAELAELRNKRDGKQDEN